MVRGGLSEGAGNPIRRVSAHLCPFERLVVGLLLRLREPLAVLHGRRVRLQGERRIGVTRIQTANGSAMQTLVPPIIAIFEQGGPTPEEIRLALERFKFTGLAEGENPARRISIYDTDEQQRQHGWSDVEGRDRDRARPRPRPNYFKVEAPAAPLPWPSYDETPAAKVLEVARGRWAWIPLRSSPTSANKNRAGVVKLVEESHVVLVDAGHAAVRPLASGRSIRRLCRAR